MATPKIETGLKETSMKSQDSGNTRKTKFEVFGEEIIEKEVKPSGNRHQNHSRRLMEKATKALVPSFKRSNWGKAPDLAVCLGFK
jgi:hypothetical protein